ncbi:hypothetical protein ACFYYB_37995 [Streptomyces sp. NPDC002886]|uniref:hypothetical protein n=2 Tax=unclassified Streptomyces TaxID=2593676 RepID=UPI0036CFFE13
MLRTRLVKAAAVASLALAVATVTPALAAHGTGNTSETRVSATTAWETAPVGKNTTAWETAPVGKNTTAWE